MSSLVSGSKIVESFVIWDACTGAVQVNKPYQPITSSGRPENLRFSPDGKTLLGGVGGGSPPAVYDVNSGKRLNKYIAPTPRVDSYSGFSWADENTKLGLLINYDHIAKQFTVTDTKTKAVVWAPRIERVNQFRWQGDVMCLLDNIDYRDASRQSENALLLWNGKTRRQLPSPPIFRRGEIYEYSFNSDGRTIAYFVTESTSIGQGPPKGELVVWDYVANRVLWRTRWNYKLYTLQWSPDGKWLAGAEIYNYYAYRLSFFDKSGNLQFQRKQVSRVVAG